MKGLLMMRTPRNMLWVIVPLGSVLIVGVIAVVDQRTQRSDELLGRGDQRRLHQQCLEVAVRVLLRRSYLGANQRMKTYCTCGPSQRVRAITLLPSCIWTKMIQ